jgi:heme exporter protein D
MYFDSVGAMLAMDGHGVYVWSAYFIAIAVVVALLLAPGRRRRKFLQNLSGELKRQQGSPTIMQEDS